MTKEQLDQIKQRAAIAVQNVKARYPNLGQSAKSGGSYVYKPTGAPALSMTPEQQKYVKNLGYTPSELPSFFNERKDQNFLESTLGQAIDRLGSGFNKAFANIYTDMGRALSTPGKPFYQVPENTAKSQAGAYLRAAPVVSTFNFLKNYLEGALGNVDYSKNVSAMREITDSPEFYKSTAVPLQQIKLGNILYPQYGGMGSIQNANDLFNAPSIQYATQGVAGLADPVANEAIGGLFKFGGKVIKGGAKALSETKIARPIIESTNATIKGFLEKNAGIAEKVANATGAGLTKEAKLAKSELDIAKSLQGETSNLLFKATTKGGLSTREALVAKAGLEVGLGKPVAEEVMKTLGDIKKGTVTIKNLETVMEAVSNPSSTKVLSPIETKLKDTFILVQNALGQKLVDEGKITQETFNAFKDHYLPFIYKNADNTLQPVRTGILAGGEKLGPETARVQKRLEPVERILKAALSNDQRKYNVLTEDQVVQIRGIAKRLLGAKEEVTAENIQAFLNKELSDLDAQKLKNLRQWQSELTDKLSKLENVKNRKISFKEDIATLPSSKQSAYLKLDEKINNLSKNYIPEKVSEFELKYKRLDEQIQRKKQVFQDLYDSLNQTVNNDIQGISYKLADNLGLMKNSALSNAVGYEQTLRLLAKDKYLSKVAESGNAWNTIDAAVRSTNLPSTFFYQVPEGAKYGALSGKVVPMILKKVIEGEAVSVNPALLGRVAESALTVFKNAKLFAPLNPAPSFRNFLTGFFQAEMGGYNAASYAKSWAKASSQYEKGGQLFDEFVKEAGVRLPNLETTSNALKTARSSNPGLRSLADTVNNFLYSGGRIPYTPFGTGRESFISVDNINRFAIYILEREKGTVPSLAAAISKNVMYDYENLPRFISEIDRVGIPFVRFTYSAAMTAVDTLIKHPEFYIKGTRLKNWIEAGAGPDTALPEYMREQRASYLKLPFVDNQYLDLTSIVPYAQGLTNENVIPKDAESLAYYLLLQNPFVKVAAELKANKKFYNNTDIVPTGMSEDGATNAKREYVTNSLGFAGPLGVAGLKTVIGGVTGQPQKLYGQDQQIVNNVLRYTLGVRSQAVDPTTTFNSELQNAQQKVNEYNARISSLSKYGNKEYANPEIMRIRKERDAFIAKSPYKGYIKNKAK